MEKIKIIADSTCDLSEEILKEYDITIIPLGVVMGESTYQDGVDITINEIYKWSEKEHSTPKTSAPLLNDVVDYIKPYVDQNMEILFFGISEDMSSTCNVVRIAAEFLDFDRIYIINSKNLSTGIGLQVVKAAVMVREGKTVNEIKDYLINEMQEKVKASFVVDTLTFLHRGGRCSSIAALLGNTFQLKPMIFVKDGKMSVGKKYRGNIKKALTGYVKDLTPDLLCSDKERVFITHSGCEEEIIRFIYNYLEQLHIFKEIIITKAGGVISSHCGPGTLGVLFVIK